jgi:hypothetical protein
MDDYKNWSEEAEKLWVGHYDIYPEEYLYSHQDPQCSGDYKITKMENSNQHEFSTRMPKVGEIVIFFPNPDDSTAKSNGAPICAAIITRPWSSVCCNVKIIPDHGPMQDRGSVTHFSANPAGYHFMFQDEYEMYLQKDTKEYSVIKEALVKEAREHIEEAKSHRMIATEHIEKAKSARVKAEDKLKDIESLPK